MDFEPVSLGPAPGFATVRRRACPEPGRRGGRRPGAGAKPGNLNALKHGRTSRQQQRLLQLIAQDPDARDLIIEIASAQRRRRLRAQREANRLLQAVTARLRERALDEAAARYENDQRIPPLTDTHPPSSRTSREKTTIRPT